jgi:hypothetical protein
MVSTIDTIERMFEYGHMTQAAATLLTERLGDETAPHETTAGDPFILASSLSAPSTRPFAPPSIIDDLQQRIRSMQATKLEQRFLPTHPAIAELLPGGGLKQGAMYSVENSATLLLALLAGPSAAGSWCGVVGVPELGIEAAASFGIDLDRLILVPNPGDQWLAVTAAIADVLTVVVAKPPRQASESNLARLSARLRQRGSTLIVVGSWPQTEAMLSLSQSSWTGIGEGHGHLTARQVTVTVSTRLDGRPHSARLWLPDPELQFTRVESPQNHLRALG